MLKEELRHTHFPYCLLKQEDGSYVVTNRNYKPIGFMVGNWVNYNEYPVGVHIKDMTPTVAASLDVRGRDSVERIYLYNDSSLPTDSKKNMSDYLARMGILMALKIAPE